MPAILVALLLVVTLGGRAHATDADWPAIEAAAKKVGKLTLYHNLPPPGDEGLIAAFKSAHPGMKVETVRLGSSALIQRFEAETTARVCPADALMIIYDEAENRWIDNGWVLEWTPPEAAAYPDEFRHRGRLFTTQLFREAIIYNTTRIKPADAPKSYADLFDPKWKGKVGLNPPWRSVAVQGVVAFWEKHLGITSIAQRLKDNDVRFFSGSAGVVQAVVRGDVWIASMIDPAVINALADGAPIAAVYPRSGVPPRLPTCSSRQGAEPRLLASCSSTGCSARRARPRCRLRRLARGPPRPHAAEVRATQQRAQDHPHPSGLLTPDYQQAMLKDSERSSMSSRPAEARGRPLRV